MQCVDIGIVSDTILELDETFFVTLEVSNPNIVLQNQAVEIIIENDDGKQTSLCIAIRYIGIGTGGRGAPNYPSLYLYISLCTMVVTF